MKLIRTIIIDDERYACERLKKLLNPFTQIELIGYLTNGIEALDFINKNKPDLVFLDVELGNNISAFDIIDSTNELLHRPCFVLITAYPQYSIKAIKHEVFDYLLKPVDVDELEDTIERLVKNMLTQPVRSPDTYSMLSDREKSVLNCILDGKSSREIADELYISLNTVNTHRRNILKKTGARSTIELMKRNKLNHE